jgi:hypothetical protein
MAGSGSNPRSGPIEEPSALLERLHLEENELDDLIWEDEGDATTEIPKWLAVARVLTTKSSAKAR